MEISLPRILLSIALVLACSAPDCSNQLFTAAQDQNVGWKIPQRMPFGLKKAVKGIQYSLWSAVPDSEFHLDLSMKYIEFSPDSCYEYYPTVDTSCFNMSRYLMVYHHGEICVNYGIATVLQKGDTLRIRWIAEYSFDHDIELYYVPCDSLPGPLCSN